MEKHLKGSRKSSTRWLARLSNRIWEITEDQWKHCNDIEHGEDKENARRKQINIDTNIKIDKLFDSAPPLRQLPVTSRHFFGKGRKWRKNRKIRDKKKWNDLTSVRSCVHTVIEVRISSDVVARKSRTGN